MNQKNAMDKFIREIVREVNRKLAMSVADDVISALEQNSSFQKKLEIIAADIATEIGGRSPESQVQHGESSAAAFRAGSETGIQSTPPTKA